MLAPWRTQTCRQSLRKKLPLDSPRMLLRQLFNSKSTKQFLKAKTALREKWRVHEWTTPIDVSKNACGIQAI
jgi:hypothetical protein